MSGPDRIWIDSRGAALGGNWGAEGGFCHLTGGTEYIRRDPATLAALPEVQALIAGAFDAAARLCWAQVKRRAEQVNSAEEGSTQRARWIAGRIQAEELAKAIEAMAPADAIRKRGEGKGAALDAIENGPFPASWWTEADGDVLWWCWRDGEWLAEAPYVGSPLCMGYTVELHARDAQHHMHRMHIGGWPGYHTHWTRLPPQPPAPRTFL